MVYKRTVKSVMCMLLVVFVLLADLGNSRMEVQGAAKTVFIPGMAVKDGRYIYYAYEGSGVRMGIMRYDVKKKKIKQIIDYKKDGKETNGFEFFNVDDKYIYAQWDVSHGSDRIGPYYIYRFSKDGKKKEKLARGRAPVLVGSYIYYFAERTNKEGDWYSEIVGIYRMKKDGSGQEKINTSQGGFLWKSGNQVLYKQNGNVFFSLDGRKYTKSELEFDNQLMSPLHGRKVPDIKVSDGNYLYFIKSSDETGIGLFSPEKLCRKNKKTGKTSVIKSFPGKIISATKCGKYLLVAAPEKNKNTGEYIGEYNGSIFCISLDGRFHKRLQSWSLGE